jgi:nucleoside-diphosphate-sugar epimerase
MHYTVLGAGGFVGMRLLASIRQQGHSVHAPTRDDDSWLQQELGHVVYCVGLTNDYFARPFDTVEAHTALLARFLHKGCFERLIYLSSTRLYDSLASSVGEESAVLHLDPANPRHLFDLSKALGENLCLHHAAGRACVARLSCVYSDTLEEGGFLAQVLPRGARGESFALDSSPAYARDYVHVDDVVALLQTMLLGGAQGIYNVGAGCNTSNGELLTALQRHTGVRVVCRHEDVQHAPRLSIAKAQQEFAFQPRQLLEHLPVILDKLKTQHRGA